MKIRVLTGHSIVHEGVAYNSGDEFELGDPSIAQVLVDAGHVEVIPAPPVAADEDPNQQARLFLLGRKISGVATEVASARDPLLRRHTWIRSLDLFLDDGTKVSILAGRMNSLWLERELAPGRESA